MWSEGGDVVAITDIGVGEPRFVACDAIRFVRADVDMAMSAQFNHVLSPATLAVGQAIAQVIADLN